MFIVELLAAGYLSALLLAGAATRRAGRLSVVAAGSMVLLVMAVSMSAPFFLRAWAPHVYLLAGYWIPALMVHASEGSATRGVRPFEAWLLRTDATIRPHLPTLPAGLVGVTELAYLLCYPLVPISFLVVWRHGSTADMAQFWLSVLSSGYACYVSLPWLLSRPPRQLGDAVPVPSSVRALNTLVLDRFSHQWNTFPSGHVAVSLAASLAAARVSLEAGIAIGLVAVAVAVGAAAGRYHYIVDVLGGLAVGAAAAVITW